MANRDKRELGGYDAILPSLLTALPEIQDGYDVMLRESNDAHLHWTEQDFIDMNEINHLHGLSGTAHSSVGLTIVMENLLIPFLVALSVDSKHSNRLAEVMAWIEELASSPEFQVRNLVSVTVCEALLTTYADHFASIFPYMGRHTRQLCSMRLADYKVDASIKKLLDSHQR